MISKISTIFIGGTPTIGVPIIGDIFVEIGEIEDSPVIEEEIVTAEENEAALAGDIEYSGTWGDDVTWTLDKNGTFTFSGSGISSLWSSMPFWKAVTWATDIKETGSAFSFVNKNLVGSTDKTETSLDFIGQLLPQLAWSDR